MESRWLICLCRYCEDDPSLLSMLSIEVSRGKFRVKWLMCARLRDRAIYKRGSIFSSFYFSLDTKPTLLMLE